MKQDYEAGFRAGMELAEEERRTAEKKNSMIAPETPHSGGSGSVALGTESSAPAGRACALRSSATAITEQLSACEDRVERAGYNMRNLSGLVALAIDSQLLDEDERNAFAYIYQALQEVADVLDETVAMLLKTRTEVAS